MKHSPKDPPALSGAAVHEDPVAAFTRLASVFAKLAGTGGVTVRANREGHCAYFAALAPDVQTKLLGHFATYVAAASDVLATGGDLRNDQVFLWALLKRLKLRPPMDLFAHFQAGDVIEMYVVPEQVQVFRNLVFFSVCSYSLDEILARPWWELYHRDPAITQRLQDFAVRLIGKTQPGVEPVDVPVHAQEERDSPEGYRFLVKNRFMAPLFDEAGQTAAFVNVVAPIAFERLGQRSGVIPALSGRATRSGGRH